MSSVKSRHIWILYILLMVYVLPVHGLDVPNGNERRYHVSINSVNLRILVNQSQVVSVIAQ
jgi:hypothetical protein